jgi:antitoxin component YwqK of YwqJK toxin-antitoxin module
MCKMQNSRMPAKRTPQKEHIEHHRNGSVQARGPMLNGMLIGYWEWFRLDGTKMRSGHFLDGQQGGEWTTYDKNGQVYKVTQMKAGRKN